MPQVEKAIVTSKDNQLVAEGKPILRDVMVEPGETCFGYNSKVPPKLGIGSPTPLGDVVGLDDNKVILMVGNSFKEYDRRHVEDIAAKYKFRAKEILNGKIGKYRLLYILQNLTKDHGFFTHKPFKEFVNDLKNDLVTYTRKKISEDLFIMPRSMRREYINADITRANLDAGKRYKKLVFVRQMGTILTKMYFHNKGFIDIGWEWGYDNHSSVIHARKTITNITEQDKHLTNHILHIVNQER